MIRIAAIVPVLILASMVGTRFVSNKDGDRFETLAAQGLIEEGAPVKAASEIVIKAPPEKVWAILTSIDRWPEWQASVSTAHLDGALKPGAAFTWKSSGTEIKSKLALVEDNQRFGWTGTAYQAKAIHIWQLDRLAGGGTLVRTKESMNGFLLKVFYSSEDLARSHHVWLEALKRKAEE